MRLIEQSEATVNGRRVVLIVTPVAATASVTEPGLGSTTYRNVTYSSVKRLRQLLNAAWARPQAPAAPKKADDNLITGTLNEAARDFLAALGDAAKGAGRLGHREGRR